MFLKFQSLSQVHPACPASKTPDARGKQKDVQIPAAGQRIAEEI